MPNVPAQHTALAARLMPGRRVEGGKRARRGSVRAIALVLSLVSALIPALVGAEAAATRIILSYVPTMSNWGPTEANGVVLITPSEGDVRADLIGLPVLDDTERYQLWLMNSETGETYPLARFNASPAGDITYVDQELAEPIPDRGWDMVIITVEPEPDPGHGTPDGRLAIVGGFPGSEAEASLYPSELPETGAIGGTNHVVSLLLSLNLGILLLIGLVRRRGSGRPATTHTVEEV